MESDSERKVRGSFMNRRLESPRNIQMEVGKYEYPIVDRFVYHGVETSKGCSSDAHMSFPTDSHLDTTSKVKKCIPMNVNTPKLEYAEVWGGNTEFVKQLETVHLTAAKRCSSTTKNAVLRAELGIYPLKTNRDVRKLN